MTKRTRAAAAWLALTVLLPSCGGENGAMQTTLTDGECRHDGRTAASAGRFSIEVENETLRFASFGLVALYEAESVDDIALAQERVASRRLQRSRAGADVPPPFGRWIAGADVEPTTRTILPVDADVGRHIIVCYVHRNTDDRRRSDDVLPPERAYVAAHIEVTDSQTHP